MYPTTTTDGMDAHVREAYESWLLYTESMERDAAGKIKRILPIVEKQNEEPLGPCGTLEAVEQGHDRRIQHMEVQYEN